MLCLLAREKEQQIKKERKERMQESPFLFQTDTVYSQLNGEYSLIFKQ